jgi:hypothetical protein
VLQCESQNAARCQRGCEVSSYRSCMWPHYQCQASVLAQARQDIFGVDWSTKAGAAGRAGSATKRGSSSDTHAHHAPPSSSPYRVQYLVNESTSTSHRSYRISDGIAEKMALLEVVGHDNQQPVMSIARPINLNRMSPSASLHDQQRPRIIGLPIPQS